MEIRDRVRELRRVLASELRANPMNWRRHPKEQHDAVRGVLQEIGYADALLAREDTDGSLVLIDGHLRAEITLDTTVPVLILDVNEDEGNKILATLDPLAAMAEADAGKLNELVGNIQFEDGNLQSMVERFAGDSRLNELATAINQDETPLPPDAAVTRPGDVWILGNHRLMCGDSASANDLDRLVDGAVVHLVNMDPPYNVKVEPRSNNAIAAGLSSFGGLMNNQGRDAARKGPTKKTEKKLRAKDRPLANDFVSDGHFEHLLRAWFKNAARVLQPGGAFYIWGGYANIGNYPPALDEAGLYFAQAIIWVKEHPVLTRKDFMGNHEWCFYGWRGDSPQLVLLERDLANSHQACFYGWRKGAGHKYYGPANATDVWSIKKVSPQHMVHLTEKPVELSARAIQYSSRPGENILDLFGGSGSTLMACEQTGRRGFLMEVDALYCDVIVKRWEEATGQKATRFVAERPCSEVRHCDKQPASCHTQQTSPCAEGETTTTSTSSSRSASRRPRRGRTRGPSARRSPSRPQEL